MTHARLFFFLVYLFFFYHCVYEHSGNASIVNIDCELTIPQPQLLEITLIHRWSQLDIFNLTHAAIIIFCTCSQYFLMDLDSYISQNINKLVAQFEPVKPL